MTGRTYPAGSEGHFGITLERRLSGVRRDSRQVSEALEANAGERVAKATCAAIETVRKIDG